MPKPLWRKVGKQRNASLESFIGKRKAMEDALGQIISPTDAPEVKCGRFMTGYNRFATPHTKYRKPSRSRSARKKSPN